MEVTTMSPSPASPTEGDDLCQTDVTSVVIHSVTLLIGLCGLAGNGAVIGLLKTSYFDFFDLAVLDFVFLLFAVPSTLLFLVEDVSCSLIVPLLYLNFFFHLSVMYLYWGLFWLMRTTDVWYLDELCQLCCPWKLPLRLMMVVDTFQYWAYFALFTVIPIVTFLCPSDQQEHCRAVFISMYTIILLFVVGPLVIFHTIDFIKAKWGSQKQQPKRRDIVIVIIVLFTLFLSLWNFLQQLGYLTVPSHVVLLLASINSTIKPFIYFLLGRCGRPCSIKSIRLSLQRVFEEPEENTAQSHDPARDTGV